MPNTRPSPDNPHLAQFAAELRDLHRQAGKPTYRELQRSTGYGRTVLSEALNGNRLPTWPVTQALVQALGGDPDAWRPRWAVTAHALEDGDHPPQIRGADHRSTVDPDDAPSRSPQNPPMPVPAPTRRSWRWPAIGATAVLLAVAMVIVAGLLLDQATSAGTDPAAGLVGGRCMQVTAKDVRVFKTPENNEDIWAEWARGTTFWVDPHTSTPSRYRTPLRNGHHGWVGADPRWVASSSGCP